MTAMKKALLPITAIILLLAGSALIVKPNIFSSSTQSDVVVIRETNTDKPLTQEQVDFFVGAEKLGVKIWDKDVLGKNKQLPKEIQVFLDAAEGKQLPVLVTKWSNGKITAKSCYTLDALKKEIGK